MLNALFDSFNIDLLFDDSPACLNFCGFHCGDMRIMCFDFTSNEFNLLYSRQTMLKQHLYVFIKDNSKSLGHYRPGPKSTISRNELKSWKCRQTSIEHRNLVTNAHMGGKTKALGGRSSIIVRTSILCHDKVALNSYVTKMTH